MFVVWKLGPVMICFALWKRNWFFFLRLLMRELLISRKTFIIT